MNGLPSSPIQKVSRQFQFHPKICSDTDAPRVMKVFPNRLAETVKPRTERFVANPRKLEKARHGPGCILNTEVVSPRKFKIIKKVQVTVSKHHFNTYVAYFSPASWGGIQSDGVPGQVHLVLLELCQSSGLEVGMPTDLVLSWNMHELDISIRNIKKTLRQGGTP